MFITRNGVNHELTSSELQDAFDEQHHNDLLEDAERHLDVYTETLQNEHGFSIDDACDKNNKSYLLQRLVAQYEHELDASISLNNTWESAIEHVLAELSAE